jgi:hypothetical protein
MSARYRLLDLFLYGGDGSQPEFEAALDAYRDEVRALATEFRVPIPKGLGGGYGEVVVQRDLIDPNRWGVTDGAVSGLRAWVEPDGWRYVADVGRAAAFTHTLDEALELASQVAVIERGWLDARIEAHRAAAEKDTRKGESTPEPEQRTFCDFGVTDVPGSGCVLLAGHEPANRHVVTPGDVEEGDDA